MGRGLVREDVNVIMFDEPLTVIDPHLKWKLRSKLKELHQRVGVTMIYVTHDQTEALTFADQVVVMNEGEVVQIGSPVDLFERPAHTFVGHFIGSPGMNVLPCELRDGAAVFARPARRHRQPRRAAPAAARSASARSSSRFADDGIPVEVQRGRRHRPLPRDRRRRPRASASTRSCPRARRSRSARRISPSRPAQTRIYIDGWLAEGRAMRTENQKAWWFVLPVVLLVAFNALIPLMTVVNYSVQETFGDNVFLWSGVRWFEQVLRSERFHDALLRSLLFTAIVLADRGAARPFHRARHAAQGPLGLGLPGADGAAAADPVERGRRDVEHHGAARDRPPRQVDERARHPASTTPATRSPPGSSSC